MTWMLQAAVLLAVPLVLMGVIKAWAYFYRKVRDGQGETVEDLSDVELGGPSGIVESKGWWGDRFDGFRDWVADRVDGMSGDGGASDCGAASDGDGCDSSASND
ncbi:hypothetical protein ACLESD_40200 [Pyxidicoccus sp. 3LFB2]